MESPVRSVESTAGSRENRAEEQTSPISPRFEAKSYLQRQVKELSCADEDEAQEKVSKRLQLKQERAKKKRDTELQRRRKGITERLRKIREARKAADARFAENAALLMERQAEKHTSATRRRRTSLENIKKARALHNRRVNQRRRESFDATGELSPTRSKGMDEIESKLARAERNRENLRCERRRRTIERYKEGRARVLQQGLLGLGSGSASVGSVRGVAGKDAAREYRRRRASEARQEAKARQKKRMRDLREHMLSHASRVSERKTRVYAIRLIQAWWRCVRTGKPFHIADLSISSVEGSSDRTSLGSPTSWAAVQGFSLSLDEGFRTGSEAGKTPREPGSPLDPCTKSPIPTIRKFSTGVCSNSPRVAESGRENTNVNGECEPCDPSNPREETHRAAVAIQSFIRRNMHALKVANALIAGRLSIKVLCAAVHTMGTSTFDEAIDVMSTRGIVSHCETALKALRMGREMRCVPHTVRSARAFLSALLVNFFPTSALDDGGVLSSSPDGTAPLQLEKDRLVRAAGNAVAALLDLEATVDAATTTSINRHGTRTALTPTHFQRITRMSANMVRARVAFCRRFAEWKRKDALRLANEMTAAAVDVMVMQLRAERDLRVAAVRYGLDDADDDGDLFSTGYEQIKEGAHHQLSKMTQALGKLVGTEEARRRMQEATCAAFERFRAHERAEDEAFLREHTRFPKKRLEPDDSVLGSLQLHPPEATSAAKPGEAATAAVSPASGASSGAFSASQAAADFLAGEGSTVDDDIAGPRRPLSAGDLLHNEWLVREVMISEEPLTVTLEEAIENNLLRSGNPAVADGDDPTGGEFWAQVESQVADEDYTPLLKLVAELRDKIIGLTPRRRDLAAETCEAMDVELLQQMMDYGAFDVVLSGRRRLLEVRCLIFGGGVSHEHGALCSDFVGVINICERSESIEGSFFRMVAFAGERVLELEAPIRNEGTKATLAGWGRTQDDVECGRRSLEPAMVRECFEYLFSKTDEIHVDILNAHLQSVTPFLKQHGVEYERERFTEKLDAGETALDMTHLWLHRAIAKLRNAAKTTTPNTSATLQTTTAMTSSTRPAGSSAVSADTLFYRQLLSDLEQRRGDAYLKLLRVAIVDNLLGAIVRVERKPSGSPSSVGKDASSDTSTEKGAPGAGCKRSGTTASAASGDETTADIPQDMLEDVAVPETLILDQYRLVGVAAGAEQVAYTASLVAFARQALTGARVPLTRADEDRVRDALMVLFETDDVTSADICAQVAEMTRLIAINSEKALSSDQLSMLTARSRNVLTTGDCPVYKLFLRRILVLLRDTLVEGGILENHFAASLRKVGLGDYKMFLLDRVVRPLMVIQRHNEAVFVTFYNDIIPLALQTSDPITGPAHALALSIKLD